MDAASSTAAGQASQTFAIPLDADLKVTVPGAAAGCHARVVGRSRGALELLGSGRRRFPAGLRPGAAVVVVMDLPQGRVTINARVQSCTATFMRLTPTSEAEFAPRRRRHVRVEMEQRVEVAWHIGRWSRESAAALIDLSEGGCQLRLDRSLPVGTPVRVSTRLDRLVDLCGVVVRESVTGDKISVGVRFENLSASERSALARFLRRRTRHL